MYASEQTLVDPGFTPLRCNNDHPDWRELQFLVKVVEDGLHLNDDLVGLFSQKFTAKTWLTSSDVYAFIESNPGGEIYTFNQGPQSPYFTYNVWLHAEDFHPGITPVAQGLLDAVGLPMDLASVGRHDSTIWCMCNFWIASPRFWNSYVGEVLRPIADYLERNPEDPAVRATLAITHHTTPTPYLPFIIERLFTTYLGHHPEWRPRVRPCLLEAAPAFTAFEHDIVDAMRDRIARADRDNDFPLELRAVMDLLRRLRRRYGMAHYATHPHPHLGRTLDEKTIARVLADLEKAPKPRLPG